jgi:hypothetical protein
MTPPEEGEMCCLMLKVIVKAKKEKLINHLNQIILTPSKNQNEIHDPCNQSSINRSLYVKRHSKTTHAEKLPEDHIPKSIQE